MSPWRRAASGSTWRPFARRLRMGNSATGMSQTYKEEVIPSSARSLVLKTVQSTSRDRAQNEVGLPAQPLRMIGREAVLDDVKERIRNDRFVTLLGPGGIGKTTVAVAAGHAMAEEFNGGVHFVDLGSLTDRRHVPAAVGTSLGLALKAKDATAELLDAGSFETAAHHPR